MRALQGRPQPRCRRWRLVCTAPKSYATLHPPYTVRKVLLLGAPCGSGCWTPWLRLPSAYHLRCCGFDIPGVKARGQWVDCANSEVCARKRNGNILDWRDGGASPCGHTAVATSLPLSMLSCLVWFIGILHGWRDGNRVDCSLWLLLLAPYLQGMNACAGCVASLCRWLSASYTTLETCNLSAMGVSEARPGQVGPCNSCRQRCASHSPSALVTCSLFCCTRCFRDIPVKLSALTKT